MKIAVILEPSEEGGYTASIPSLPGCISEGKSVEEALGNIREAFELLIESTDDDLIIGERDLIEALVLDWVPADSVLPIPQPEPESQLNAEPTAPALSRPVRNPRPSVSGRFPQAGDQGS